MPRSEKTFPPLNRLVIAHGFETENPGPTEKPVISSEEPDSRGVRVSGAISNAGIICRVPGRL